MKKRVSIISTISINVHGDKINIANLEKKVMI